MGDERSAGPDDVLAPLQDVVALGGGEWDYGPGVRGSLVGLELSRRHAVHRRPGADVTAGSHKTRQDRDPAPAEPADSDEGAGDG